LFFTSCKDNQKTVDPNPVDRFATAKSLVEKQVAITGQMPSFTSFQQINVAWGGNTSESGINYNYTFDENENLREVKDAPQTFAFTFLHSNDVLTRQFGNLEDTYTLDSERLATKVELGINVPNGSKCFYFYKNGHRVVTVGSGIIEKNEYSSAGNLVKRTFNEDPVDASEKNALNYEYTNFPNTINQEVFGFQLLNINPRTVNLGKFNTNLIKKITIEEGFMKGKTIEFDYEFDSQNRVSRINIIRDGMPITMEYQY
jgi:hypothetical protein